MALIELKGITKVYEMGGTSLNALDGVDISIEEGELVAIMGSSGSGKSTLMNMIGCLDRPTAGRYVLDGREVSDLSRSERAEVRNRFIGFVFQSFNLLSRTTALENVELPLVYAGVSKKERAKRARASLEKVGLGDRVMHRPTQLSGGQQQRVAIARALVNTPKLVLGDEPTGNLDSRTSLEVMALLQGLWRTGQTIVFVTHDAEVAELAARVIVMRDGKVLSDERREARLVEDRRAS
ncbi:MAG: ABC transporter ATP-binding protein [Myxococcota bacterium]